MLHKRYSPAVWSRQLYNAFPHLPQGRGLKSLRKEINEIVSLRNRIWHHEPIFKRDLSDDYRRVMQMINWLSPVQLAWIRPHCRIQTVLRQKP